MVNYLIFLYFWVLTHFYNILAFGVVPQLSGVLASMLPMLGMAKFDNYKSAFASCKTFFF